MSRTYENGAAEISIEKCEEMYNLGLAIIITDGRNVTLQIDEQGGEED